MNISIVNISGSHPAALDIRTERQLSLVADSCVSMCAIEGRFPGLDSALSFARGFDFYYVARDDVANEYLVFTSRPTPGPGRFLDAPHPPRPF